MLRSLLRGCKENTSSSVEGEAQPPALGGGSGSRLCRIGRRSRRRRDMRESVVPPKLPETTITAAQSIPAGTYTAPNGQVFTHLPAFCRVAATLTPTSDSDIGIEIWMPASSWNGKFEGVGNGGFAGSIEYSALASGVTLGYATVSTDTGHVGSTYDGSFALGHPQKIIDFGYRSVHLMTVRGKQIAAAFYGENPQRSYFDGLLDRRATGADGSAALLERL